MSMSIERDRIERAARIYASNRDAGLALGIAPSSFGRLCRRYGVETPKVRRQRRHSDLLRNTWSEEPHADLV